MLFCVWYTQDLSGNEAQVQDEKKITSKKSLTGRVDDMSAVIADG